MRILLFGLAIYFGTMSGATAFAQNKKPEWPSEVPVQPVNPDAFINNIKNLATETATTPLTLNPFQTDISSLEIAINLSDGFRLIPNKTILVISVDDGTEHAPLDKTFIFEPTDNIESETLDAERIAGKTLKAFKISKKDHDKAASVHQRLDELKANSTGQNTLRSAIAYSICNARGEQAPDTYSITLFTKSSTNPFEKFGGELIVERRPEAQSAWNACDLNVG